jgi:hypothetical protein
MASSIAWYSHMALTILFGCLGLRKDIASIFGIELRSGIGPLFRSSIGYGPS